MLSPKTESNQSRFSTRYRQHKFPPLRKVWVTAKDTPSTQIDPAEYQRQLVEGFQEGVDKGYAQGLEQGKEEGFREGSKLGYNEGVKKGEQEGWQSGQELFIQATQPFDNLLQKMHEYFDCYDHQRRQQLLQLVEKVTKQVIRCELALQPTQLLALVEEALSGLEEAPNTIKVLMNPEEFARINDVKPEKVEQWGLTADPAMEMGECRIITETREMDVGCGHRLEQCMTMLGQNLLPES